MSQSTRSLPTDVTTRDGGTARSHPLTHIQGLRALAVSLVVLYHLWPTKLSGGYVGVDVFFVVSGYLMTGHILRGAQSGRSVLAGLNDFYSRRIRRILPAALLVLAVTGLVTLFLVSRIRWASYLHEVMASALYVENWSLAASSTDYLAAGTGASPVQHFWSLSVEEQFYLIWPVLLLLLVVAVRATNRSRSAGDVRERTTRHVLALLIGLIVVSVAYSVFSTNQDSKFAYFDTFARLWEFGVGGLVAVAGSRLRLTRPQSAALSWLGLAAIAYSALAYSGDSQFPGWIAGVPVLGAAAVLQAGERASIWGPQTVLAIGPVQFLGNISYSLYLWHWPMIVLVPTVIGSPLRTPLKLGLLVGAVVIAWVSKVVVEDPLRSRPADRRVHRRAGHPWRLYALTLAAMAVVSVGPASGLISLNGQLETARVALAASRADAPDCFGAQVLSQTGACSSTRSQLSSVVPDPLIATEDFPVQGCQQVASRSDVLTCTFGSTSATATRVALAGDSHATQWLPALLPIAIRNNWNITTFVKSGCPLSTAGSADSCGRWNSAVIPKIKGGSFTYVFVSARGYAGVSDDDTSDDRSYTVSGMTAAFGELGAGGARVVPIRDIPQPTNAGVANEPACVYGKSDPSSCAFSEARATRFDLIPAAASKEAGLQVVDMNQYFCSAGKCPPVIGNVLVYLDGGHMTSTYARSLTSVFALGLRKAGVVVQSMP